MPLQEIVFYSTAAAGGARSGPGAICLNDLQTGTTIATFKQTSAARNCTAYVESTGAEGGFILSSQPDKSIMNVYNFQKDQISMKMVLPERLTCIAVDSRGTFCAGGTAQGRVFLWEIASGIMYNAWDAHYRQVTVLRFTPDGAVLLSGSEDSGISVWSVSRLVDENMANELPVPEMTLSDHTLSVTDIRCGAGRFTSCRVLTSSLDYSVKLWDLSSQTLLTTFQFPKPISCLAWDATENFFFAAASEGAVYQVNLFRPADESSGTQATAVGGEGVNDIIRVDDTPTTSKKRLISVTEGVTVMTISCTSASLLVATPAGSIHVYDIASHQLVRTIRTLNGLSVTHVATMMRPPDLIGHVSLSLGAGDGKDTVSVRPVAIFQRTRDVKARAAHEVPMLLPPCYRDSSLYEDEELLRDHAFFVQRKSAGAHADVLQARVSDLEADVALLRDQLGRAKNINDVMWENVVQKLVKQRPNASPSEDDADQRKRKRGRT
ncbi:WD40 repeat-like protein [Fistulina hepatica ATCC 64428]|uniref:Pre-rRNA-processing protein IPI3 n=1 Tax=Fistulina hepatica ATCC 64428 TaxID=1128425 RepID=A0A0D7AQ10_9AGAR|nr:WD40 repeat-like protein [Fistulina hepatica ATCC 64428]